MPKPSALFLHANGYPSAVYQQFLSHLSQAFEVLTPESLQMPLDTAANHAAADRCPQMSRNLSALLAHHPEPLTLIGHSMGGYLALLAAVDHPPVKAVILLDSPLAPGWRGVFYDVIQRLGLSYWGGPAPIALRRRWQWPSRAAAREFFAGKAFVQRWAAGVLDDFIEHGLVADANGVVLAIPRETEADVYAHLPARAGLLAYRQLRQRGTPVGLIAGSESIEVNLANRANNQALLAPHWCEMPGGHLLPFEAPAACAEAVIKMYQTLVKTP